MFISDGLTYLTFRCPTDEKMGSYTKVIVTPSGEWKPSDLDNDGQWEDCYNNVSFSANVSATNFTQSNNVIYSILSALQYDAPNITCANNMAFNKSTTNNNFFYDIWEQYTHDFDNCSGFSTSLSIGSFGPNHVYADTHTLVYISSSISEILSDDYTIDSNVR